MLTYLRYNESGLNLAESALHTARSHTTIGSSQDMSILQDIVAMNYY